MKKLVLAMLCSMVVVGGYSNSFAADFNGHAKHKLKNQRYQINELQQINVKQNLQLNQTKDELNRLADVARQATEQVAQVRLLVQQKEAQEKKLKNLERLGQLKNELGLKRDELLKERAKKEKFLDLKKLDDERLEKIKVLERIYSRYNDGLYVEKYQNNNTKDERNLYLVNPSKSQLVMLTNLDHGNPEALNSYREELANTYDWYTSLNKGSCCSFNVNFGEFKGRVKIPLSDMPLAQALFFANRAVFYQFLPKILHNKASDVLSYTIPAQSVSCETYGVNCGSSFSLSAMNIFELTLFSANTDSFYFSIEEQNRLNALEIMLNALKNDKETSRKIFSSTRLLTIIYNNFLGLYNGTDLFRNRADLKNRVLQEILNYANKKTLFPVYDLDIYKFDKNYNTETYDLFTELQKYRNDKFWKMFLEKAEHAE